MCEWVMGATRVQCTELYCMAYNAWRMAHGEHRMAVVHGEICMAYNAWRMAHGERRMAVVHGEMCMALGAWGKAHGAMGRMHAAGCSLILQSLGLISECTQAELRMCSLPRSTDAPPLTSSPCIQTRLFLPSPPLPSPPPPLYTDASVPRVQGSVPGGGAGG